MATNKNITRLKKVQADAKKLKAKNPKLTHIEAVKKAWAMQPKVTVQKSNIKRKKIGALPNTFTGNILGVGFKVHHQFDIYGDVTSIIEDVKNGDLIIKIDGKGNAADKANLFIYFIENRTKDVLTSSQKTRIKSFVSNLTNEVKMFNSGKKKTIKKMPLKIVKQKNKIVVKKIPTKKQTGVSNRRYDIMKQAMTPGKRVTSWGTTYYESRANRSDKGKLLGVETIGSVMAKGKSILIEKLGKLEAKKFVAKKISDKRKLQKEITTTKTQLRKFL